MLDCLLLMVPKLVVDAPTVGPPLLKAYLTRNGFTAKVIDYNIALFNNVNDSAGKEIAQEAWFKNNDHFGPGPEFLSLYDNHLAPFVQQYAKDCVNENANWIGISVFSYISLGITWKFIEEIKKIKSDQKIVLGGPGATTYKEHVKKFIEPDSIILGDADDAIVSLLKGEPISDEFYYLRDFKNLPYPDYSDMDWSLYHKRNEAKKMHDFPIIGKDRKNYNKGGKITVTGSRGCVRACTFCDIKHIWPKFTYRPGKDIAGEMIYLNEEYGFSFFTFTDSLINGSLKAFREICTEVKKVKEKNKNINWGGQFICRSYKQMPEELWADMRDSGLKYINIGIESGSESVRNHMKKKFSNEDMYYTFDMASKYNISTTYNLIIGYPTETEEDFNDTLSLIKNVSILNKDIKEESKHSIGFFGTLATMSNIDLVTPEMIEELGLINAIGKGRLEHWEIKNQPEGLPYNQAIRLRRLITVLALLNETEHKVTGSFAIRKSSRDWGRPQGADVSRCTPDGRGTLGLLLRRELPRMLNKYKELTGENLNTSELLEARKHY